MFETIGVIAFWVMIIAFGAMVIVRWVEAVQNNSAGGALVFTIVAILVGGATIYREFYLALPNVWWKPAANLGAVLLNIVLLVAAFLVFTATVPQRFR